MTITLAFDVYGTLIDTNGVVEVLHNIVGDKAGDFSRSWREKQLEYSFRRGLMKKYENFAVCISHALDYSCAYYKVSLSNAQKDELLAAYRVLPAFKDVKESLTRLKDSDYRLYAFSNGSEDAIESLLSSANIRDYFLDIISVDGLRSFKPDPDVYNHFLKTANTNASNAWLISCNPFDVIGAVSAGMKAAWLQRTEENIFDPWGIEPTITISKLSELKDKIAEYQTPR